MESNNTIDRMEKTDYAFNDCLQCSGKNGNLKKEVSIHI